MPEGLCSPPTFLSSQSQRTRKCWIQSSALSIWPALPMPCRKLSCRREPERPALPMPTRRPNTARCACTCSRPRQRDSAATKRPDDPTRPRKGGRATLRLTRQRNKAARRGPTRPATDTRARATAPHSSRWPSGGASQNPPACTNRRRVLLGGLQQPDLPAPRRPDARPSGVHQEVTRRRPLRERRRTSGALGIHDRPEEEAGAPAPDHHSSSRKWIGNRPATMMLLKAMPCSNTDNTPLPSGARGPASP